MTTKSERPCPVCKSTAYAPFADEHIDDRKVNDFTYASRKEPEFMCLRLVRCLECDVVYAPEPTAAEELTEAYSHASYDSSPEAVAAAKSYARALSPHIEKLDHRHAAVDVGAGSGPLLPWMLAKGFSPVLGIEPSQAAIDAAPEDVRPLLRKAMFHPDILKGTPTSLICSFMTLEHISEPGDFIRDTHTLLESGGMVAVIVHNWRAPLNRLLGLKSPIIDVEHLQLFSEQALQRLLQEHGFTHIKVLGITNRYPLRYWLRLTPLPSKMKAALTSLLEFLRIADIHMPMRVGNMLGIGIKP